MSQEIISFYSDRIIAFHRGYVDLTGSVTAALLLGQACYWSKINQHQQGWFYKTQAEWEEELGLTRRQQEAARSILQHLPFWKEKKEGLPLKLYFKVDLQALSEFIKTHENTKPKKAPNPENEPELPSAILVCTDAPYKDVQNVQTSMAESAIHIIRNTKITNIDYNKEVNTVLDISTAREPLAAHMKEKKKIKSDRVWNDGRITLYKLLFRFYSACGESLGLGKPVFYEAMPEDIPWALPAVIEDKFASLLRDYMKTYKVSLPEIEEQLEYLGKYIQDKKPFVFQKKSVLSLESLCDHPQWFREWMTESFAIKESEQKKPKESIPAWKQEWDQYSENQREEHYSFGKKAIDDLKIKLIH